MKICSVDGCGLKHDSHGYCSTHAHRFRKYGDPLLGGAPYASAKRYFEDVVLPYDGDECLDWPHSKSPYGYGQLRSGGKLLSVHRLACEAANGPAPSPKHDAAHSCGRGHFGCSTKRHLSWKTRKENFADKLAHGTHGFKLSAQQVLEIRSLTGTAKRSEIAHQYGIIPDYVRMIVNREVWSHLPD